MSRKQILPAGHMAGGIAVVLFIVAMAAILGGCASPTSGGDSHVTVTPSASLQPSVTPTPVPTPNPEPTIVPEEIIRTYEWTFNNQTYAAYFGVLKSDYDLYKSRPHARGSDYSGYKISVDERIYFVELVTRLMDAIVDNELTENCSAMAVAGFLQSLPNASLDMTTPYDDYPKYPLETLADGGGDSEDMSILAASLLDQMGYSTVLLGFPGHMMVGIQSRGNLTGSYYEYNGTRYYCLETMPPLRGLGDIPDQYRNAPATVYTI